jgi:hypothetical protein
VRGAGPLGRRSPPAPVPLTAPDAADDVDDDAVHVHFPVEIEVRVSAPPIDVEEIVDHALRKLARGVAATK